ncbi:hypothetical protein [Sphingobacterium sp. SYP-B4668]|uniref:hypothetical protein n=1 Tax=Sphingobacterium sp. SYP-B4668 TaxID=2996035 RepID=UPI0005323002|nr:hypothetical protein [Sphingobacterium sp. SYP-B4668]
MENTTAQRQPKKTDNNANRSEYYVTLTVAIVIGLAGVFARFIQDSFLFSTIANILLIIATIIAFKTVFAILGFGSKK